ncbi:hypothetical protein ACFSTC_03260 [Nonomuraea ferruginea]
MTALLICTALGMEARAVRRGLCRSPVHVRLRRTGLGPRRAARVAAILPEFDALAVTGFAGSLVPGLRAGGTSWWPRRSVTATGFSPARRRRCSPGSWRAPVCAPGPARC